MTEARLTNIQRQTLARLAALTASNPLVSMGFNAASFGGERYSAAARALADKGLVALDRVSERHIRYAITPAGRALLSKGEG